MFFAPAPSDLNEKKATQAAARFLTAAGKRMHYLKLLKLMYLMDREALIRWGAPVTNDQYFSLPKGPILSRVKNLMVEEPSPGERGFWADHISSPTNYVIELVDETGDDELSEAEEELIDEVYERYGHIDRFKLIDLLHEILPEWKDPNGSSIPITIADILAAGNKTSNEITEIESDLSSVRSVHALFAGSNTTTEIATARHSFEGSLFPCLKWRVSRPHLGSELILHLEQLIVDVRGWLCLGPGSRNVRRAREGEISKTRRRQCAPLAHGCAVTSAVRSGVSEHPEYQLD